MKYRKKPVVIEAVQWNGLNLEEIKEFVGEDLQYNISDTAWEVGKGAPHVLMEIHTLEGDMEVSKGDFIIKGVNGEFYPCKPDIFEKTYEAADCSPKIRIESDGHFAKVYLDGEKVRCTSLDFHGDVDNNVRLVDGDVVTGGICIKWDGTVQKLNESGQPYADENGELATEEFHYDNREAVVE